MESPFLDLNPVYRMYLRRMLRKGKLRWLWLTLFVLGSCGAAFAVFALFLNNGVDTASSSGFEVFSLIKLQEFLIFVFTPALAAGVIAGERERQSLELLLLTPITTRSIILQKLLGICTYAALVPLFFLPATALLLNVYISDFASHSTFDSMLYMVLLSLPAMLIKLVCLASVGMLASTLNKKTVTAVVMAYSAIVVYWFISLVISAVIVFTFSNALYSSSNNIALLTSCVPFCIYLPITYLCVVLSIRQLDRMRKPA